MKSSLQLKLGQQLTMTPQLQQAIRLLQLSTLELDQEVQQMLDSNPMLEREPTQETSQTEPSAKLSDAEPQEQLQSQNWEPMAHSDSDFPDFDYQGQTHTDLASHLQWQLDLSELSPHDQLIATCLIDSINSAGYLQQSLSEIRQAVIHLTEGAMDIEEQHIEQVLAVIQQFEPLGVGSRSLQECLDLQLRALPKNTPHLDAVRQIVTEHIDLLGRHDYRTLGRKTNLKEEVLREAIQLIQTLEPRPGNLFDNTQASTLIPDVLVQRHEQHWQVSLNPECRPKLKVNEMYSQLGQQAKGDDRQYFRQHLQEARWFIKSLESRHDTLLRVSRYIVERQQEFLEQGEMKIQPMVLEDVAEAIDMHQSTVSRVTTQKYMHTPQGVFELKYFFSSHVETDSGGECSSTAVRALIKQLISEEESAKPLSDSKLAAILAERGIKVARRTVAKYRESLQIPPSNQRKSLI